MSNFGNQNGTMPDILGSDSRASHVPVYQYVFWFHRNPELIISLGCRASVHYHEGKRTVKANQMFLKTIHIDIHLCLSKLSVYLQIEFFQ